MNGDTTLAESALPGGLRSINTKTYADWFCFFGFYCPPHDNGQIFANVLWDIRERLRRNLVGGSEAAAINESHQLYVDALKLSPPAPTMLDMRDAMLLADGLRNPGSPRSANFCRVWESFAGRGMGVSAMDTADTWQLEPGQRGVSTCPTDARSQPSAAHRHPHRLSGDGHRGRTDARGVHGPAAALPRRQRP